MAYTNFDKVVERYRIFEKCQTFKEDEPVRCTERQYDEDGILDEDSILIVSDTLLTKSGIEKVKSNEKLSDDDMKYMCCHIETERYFWIKGSKLKKAVDEEATNVVNAYHRKCFRKEICSNIVGGLIFIILLMFSTIIAIFLMEKLFNIILDNIYIISMFAEVIVGIALIIIVCAVSICKYRKKIR